MKEIVRMQHTLQIGDGGNALVRHHPIPLDVQTFAGILQVKLTGKNKRKERPTRADIYFWLVCEGIDLIKPDTVFGGDFGDWTTRVKYPLQGYGEINERLKDLKKAIDAGEYQNIPSVRKDGRVYREGVLELIPVTLMRLAISERQKSELDQDVLDMIANKTSQIADYIKARNS